jgi:hypothetical protein
MGGERKHISRTMLAYTTCTGARHSPSSRILPVSTVAIEKNRSGSDHSCRPINNLKFMKELGELPASLPPSPPQTACLCAQFCTEKGAQIGALETAVSEAAAAHAATLELSRACIYLG